MPPRVPFVTIFVAAYFAVGFGGGADALSWSLSWAPDWRAIGAATFGVLDWVRPPQVLTLTISEALALAAASAAVVDSAWRPSQSLADGAVSLIVAIAAFAGAAVTPEWVTPGLAVIVALALGDAGAALWRRRPAQAG